MLRTLLGCLAVLLLVAEARCASAAPVAATVQGVEAVNVRRGPGLDSDAFLYLRRGTVVQVEEIDGQWGRVTLPSGETGYINAAYLKVEPGVTLPLAATPTAATSAEASPAATAAVESTPGTAALEHQLAQLRERLNALESAVVTPPAGGTPTAIAAADVRPAAPLPTAVTPPDEFDIGPSLALAGVGLVLGFLLGAAYGQRQERRRRSRVRF